MIIINTKQIINNINNIKFTGKGNKVGHIEHS